MSRNSKNDDIIEFPIQNRTRLIVDDEPEDRYSRLRLIPWWDQAKLRNARILVIGAGALGNEILKNLALLGAGNIVIIDLDRVENSNLSRSILYREDDEGQLKAAAAAEQVKDINPDCRTVWMHSNVIYDLGLGIFRWADVVLAGLDNREARLAINQACWKVGTPWVDGAIEALFGIARVFVPPDGSCYECTMNETDYRLLNLRKSCTLLTRNEMVAGKVPTTPTSASVVAGVQVQEAIKLIHQRPDLPVLAGKGWFFNGLTHDSYVIEYPRKESCLGHETYHRIKAMPLSVYNTKIIDMLAVIRQEIGDTAIMELNKDLIVSLDCQACGESQPIYKSIGSVSEEQARCTRCGEIRTPILTQTLNGDEPFVNKTLSEIGIPPFDIITGVNGSAQCHIELSGDAPNLLNGLDISNLSS